MVGKNFSSSLTRHNLAVRILILYMNLNLNYLTKMSTFPALKHGSILSLACPLGQPLGKVLSPSRRFIAEAEQRLAHCSPRLFDFTEKWIILKNGQRLLKIGIDATRKNILPLCFSHRPMFFNRKF